MEATDVVYFTVVFPVGHDTDAELILAFSFSSSADPIGLLERSERKNWPNTRIYGERKRTKKRAFSKYTVGGDGNRFFERSFPCWT